MRIVFMGTPDFAVPCLEKLIACGHKVVGVFSQPDKPVGRKQVLTPPPVKECAMRHGIEVYQPQSLKTDEAAALVRALQPEVIVVVAYGKILPKAILEAAPHGCINVHASLLPQYRGAAPIQWAVINGDVKTGVTVMQMDEGLDTGDMLLVEETAIGENETSAELFDRLSAIGAEALIKALSQMESGSLQPQPQLQGDFGYAKMITKALCPIDWTAPAQTVHNLVRGLQTWPVALTTVNGKNLKIHKTILGGSTDARAGEVVDNHQRLAVACGDGRCVEILELQLDGKKKMDVKAFLQGNPIPLHTILGEQV